MAGDPCLFSVSDLEKSLLRYSKLTMGEIQKEES